MKTVMAVLVGIALMGSAVVVQADGFDQRNLVDDGQVQYMDGDKV